MCAVQWSLYCVCTLCSGLYIAYVCCTVVFILRMYAVQWSLYYDVCSAVVFILRMYAVQWSLYCVCMQCSGLYIAYLRCAVVFI